MLPVTCSFVSTYLKIEQVINLFINIDDGLNSVHKNAYKCR
jgi:hypothetical protein